MNFIVTSIVLSVLATILFRFFRKRYPNFLQPFLKKGKTRAVRQMPRVIRMPERRIVVRHAAAVENPPRTRANIKALPPRILPINAKNIPIIRYRAKPEPILETVFAEMLPQIRKIIDSYRGQKRSLRYLAIPYMYFLIILYYGQLVALYHYFSPVRINGLNSILYFCPFTNTGSEGKLCWGDEAEFIEINSRLVNIPSIRGRIVEVINEYWTTAFNNHLAETHQGPWGMIDRRLSSYESWEKATRQNPQFIFSIPWSRRPAGSVDYILNRVWRQ